MKLKVKRKHDDITLPSYQTEGSAGFDLTGVSFLKLYSSDKEINLKEVMTQQQKNGIITLRPGERVLIGTGLHVAVPQGYELQIRSRSSYALKKGLLVANSPGTIDSDYRGEIGVILINTTHVLLEVKLGERIAQAVLKKIEQADFELVEELDDTDRGEGGFGSTGK